MFWVLGAFILIVNVASTQSAIREVRRAPATSPASPAQINATLLLVRCVVLLAFSIVALLLWSEPQWLIGVCLVTSAVQALDLIAALVLRSRRVILAASVGLILSVGPLLIHWATGA